MCFFLPRKRRTCVWEHFNGIWELKNSTIFFPLKGEFSTDLVKRNQCILKGEAPITIGQQLQTTQFSIQLKQWHFLFHFLSSRWSENEQTWIIITNVKKRKCSWMSLFFNWFIFSATFSLEWHFFPKIQS